MQIHEIRFKNNEPIPVTGTAAFGQKLKATGKAMRQDPKSLIDPHRYGRAKQAGYAASAERSAQDLIDKGYGKIPSTTATSANQMVSQIRNDAAAQQLVNNWASQWSTVAAKIPSTQSRQQPVTEQANPTAYKAAFVSWADQVVERTTRMTGVISRLKQKPEWQQLFANAAQAVADTANEPQQNQKAVQEYLTLAVAAARAEHQTQGTPAATRAGIASGLNDPRADALARAIGIDSTDVTRLNAFIRRQGETVNPQGTGSESLDALLRAAKLLR